MTVYPMDGFDAIPDAAFDTFVSKIADIVRQGQKVMIRYASEMNGSWFAYGQQPTLFKNGWNKMVWAVRNATLEHPGAVSFLWSPNLGSGYPFTGYGMLPFSHTSGFDPEADTNAPYYPGDDTVDWVGMSIYHYANSYPYESNDIPPEGKLIRFLTGAGPDYGYFNMYRMFCGDGSGGNASLGGKPFFISETGASTHLELLKNNVWTRLDHADAQSRAQMKQAWWRQYLNKAFLQAFPKVKGVSLFEFTKREDYTIRDFRVLGKGQTFVTPLGDDAEALDGLTLEAFRADVKGPLGDLIVWADAPSSQSASSSAAASTLQPASGAAVSAPQQSMAQDTCRFMPIVSLMAGAALTVVL
ncbi:hypothetical protein HDU91_003263 [Kappamyces sp. JEL0680]|nr:hypothetical protein HDU91_003263 [Kappamyces sp. JEL0680]